MNKNRVFSAKGLDGIVAMEFLLTPILNNYTLNSNLRQRTNAITKNGVKIGAVADMLLSDQLGEQVGFLKFNFSSEKLKKEEAEVKLHVLKTFFENKGLDLHAKSCMLVDVAARRIYTIANVKDSETTLQMATIEIRDNWDLFNRPSYCKRRCLLTVLRHASRLEPMLKTRGQAFMPVAKSLFGSALTSNSIK